MSHHSLLWKIKFSFNSILNFLPLRDSASPRGKYFQIKAKIVRVGETLFLALSANFRNSLIAVGAVGEDEGLVVCF